MAWGVSLFSSFTLNKFSFYLYIYIYICYIKAINQYFYDVINISNCVFINYIARCYSYNIYSIRIHCFYIVDNFVVFILLTLTKMTDFYEYDLNGSVFRYLEEQKKQKKILLFFFIFEYYSFVFLVLYFHFLYNS